jgi:hypothetical protein
METILLRLTKHEYQLEQLIPENITFNKVEDVPPPNYYEVNQVIEKLKTHEVAELIK